MALIEKLEAIGDAIRAKNGAEDKYTLEEMVTAIGAIETGGGGSDIPDDFYIVTGDSSYRFSNNNMNYFLENEPHKSKWSSNKITNPSYMFTSCGTLEEIPFNLNMTSGTASNPIKIDGLFQNCYKLKTIPELETEVYISGLSSIFSYCRNLREIPQSWYNNIKFDYVHNQNYPSISSIFQSCHSLRKVDADFVAKCHGKETTTSVSGAIYYGGFNACYALDEIAGIPTVGTQTSNVFSSTFSYCYRLKDLLFDTNEDGTAKAANWKSQTIDLTQYVGYTNMASNITGYNSGITSADKAPTTDYATFTAFVEANLDNWWTDNFYYSRYNLDSAVNTINSLPDTSAYLASAGGTNTIKFQRNQGSAIGKNISNLTAEQIAVATAKGWTVTLS